MDVNQISIYGLGTLGSNLMVLLARTVPGRRFVGYDFDVVESKNLANQNYFREHIGLPKVKAMQILLSRLNNVNYSPVVRRVESVHKPAPNELWIDCFDNTESRALFPIGEYPILHIGISPEGTGEIIWAKNYSAPGPVNPNAPEICTNPLMSGLTQIVVGLAAQTIINYLTHDHKDSYIVRYNATERSIKVYET